MNDNELVLGAGGNNIKTLTAAEEQARAIGHIQGYLAEQNLTSSGGNTALDVALGTQPLMTLTEATTLALPTNMSAAQTISIAGTQAAGQYSLSVDAAYVVMTGNASLTAIASLADGEAFEISIKRAGSQYRMWVTTQTA